jgi:hypothetical protein
VRSAPPRRRAPGPAVRLWRRRPRPRCRRRRPARARPHWSAPRPPGSRRRSRSARAASGRPSVQPDRARGAAGPHFERRAQAAFGEDRRVDAAGQVSQLVQRTGQAGRYLRTNHAPRAALTPPGARRLGAAWSALLEQHLRSAEGNELACSLNDEGSRCGPDGRIAWDCGLAGQVVAGEGPAVRTVCLVEQHQYQTVACGA